MSKITVRADKLKVKDRLKVGGVTFKIVSLNKSFGRKKSKHNSMFHHNVRISLRNDETETFTTVSFPDETQLTVRRK